MNSPAPTHSETLTEDDNAHRRSKELSANSASESQPIAGNAKAGLTDPQITAVIKQTRLATGLLSTITGAMGLGGLLVDLPGFYTTAVINVARIAKFHGYDPTQPEERDFIFQILLIGHLPTEESRLKELAMIHSENPTRLYAKEFGSVIAARGSTLSAYRLASKMFTKRFRFLVPVIGSVTNVASNLRFMESIMDTAIRGYSRRASLRTSVDLSAD